jgi:formate dehydrogenase maturation protein FdhE
MTIRISSVTAVRKGFIEEGKFMACKIGKEDWKCTKGRCVKCHQVYKIFSCLVPDDLQEGEFFLLPKPCFLCGESYGTLASSPDLSRK